jgi:uncharacterized protein with HEPN domain
MPSSSDAGFLTDIASNIALARAFVGDLSFAQFEADPKSVYAVTRCLEIISEASRRLSDDFKAHHSELDWKEMAGRRERVSPRLSGGPRRHPVAHGPRFLATAPRGGRTGAEAAAVGLAHGTAPLAQG